MRLCFSESATLAENETRTRCGGTAENDGELPAEKEKINEQYKGSLPRGGAVYR